MTSGARTASRQPPSFAATDRLVIVERLASRWEELSTKIAGRPDYRILINTHLVPFVSVSGQLSPVDGAIELIAIVIVMTPPMI